MIEDLRVFFIGLPTVSLAWDGGGTEYAYFDDAFFDAQLGESVLESTQPRLTCIYSEVAHLSRKDALTVDGVAYSVLEVQPDGTGLAIVPLSKDSD